jgi:hypothetical protein
MTSKLLNFTAFILVQFVSSCAAPLSEQCRQLKVASRINTESYYASEREKDSEKQSELLSQSFREKAKILKNLSLSDSHLKGIQAKLIKWNEEFAEFKPTGSRNTANQLTQLTKEFISIDNDLKNYCQS